MSEISDPKPTAATPDYWASRQNAFYYRNVLELLCGMARDAKSAIDVGSRNTPILESCHWIKQRVCIDISKPYSSKDVTGIKVDFFDYKPEKKFDVAICLQVLEHIDDAPAFARKLFDVAKSVLISVPYHWPAGSAAHPQDPVDELKLLGWTGREPSHSFVVTEPLVIPPKNRRLISYYHDETRKFSLVMARRNMIQLSNGDATG